jgi:flagellar hook assembly protein FlgD
MRGRRVPLGPIRRSITFALSGALLATGLIAGPASAAGELTSSIGIRSITADTQSAFVPVTFHVETDVEGISEPAPCPGSIKIFEIVNSAEVEVMSQEYCSYGGLADLVYQAGFDLGTHTFKAKWVIDPTNHYLSSESATQQYTVLRTDSFVSIYAAPSVEAHNPITIQTPVGSWTNVFATNSTVTVTRSGSATPLCVITVVAANTMSCTFTLATPGTYTITATYSGNTWVQGSSSQVQLSVLADTVHASGVGTQYTTFYPVTDAYRDTVGVKGTRGEAASVTIKIYSPGGTLLKTVSIASGSGAYNYNWNGRNSSGTIYSEGSYKFVQTLKDSFGTTKTYTNYVTLSKKKLYTYTKTITKLGSSVSAKGTANGGTVSINTTSGYAKLYAPTNYTSWAGAGYELTIPSATIYKWMYVRIYGRHAGVGGETLVGAQNFTTCAYSATATWYDTCFASWASINSTTGTTLYYYRTAGLTSAYRSAGKVRLLVTSSGGTTYIYRAEVRLEYQVLKY